MEAGADLCPTRDRCSLASGKLQVVLDVDFAASDPGREKMRDQRIVRDHFPHGFREGDLGVRHAFMAN
jgi:hypothetical protein